MVSGTFFERRLVLFKVGGMVPGDVPSSTTALKWTKKVYTLGSNNGDEDNNGRNNSEIKMPCTFAYPGTAVRTPSLISCVWKFFSPTRSRVLLDGKWEQK